MDRVAPEKQIRPLPSIVFFTDSERTNMKYELENCSAELTMGKEPMVTFVFHGSERKDKFFASQVLACAARVESFTISPGWDDEPCQTVGSYDIHVLAQLITQALPLSVGEYRMVWVPNDPSLPF